MADNVNRFLGGPPLAVLGKLILLSILIGVVLSALGLDPLNIFSQPPAPDPRRLEHGLRRGALALAAISCSAR